MKAETLTLLEEILNGKAHTLTKCDDEEVFSTLKLLESYNILIQKRKGVLALNGFANIENLQKLIQLKNIDDFQTWLLNKRSISTQPISITANNIGQINNNSVIKESVINAGDQNSNEKDKKISILSKVWKIISENKLISGILLLIICYLIKEYFGINLK